MFGMAELKRVFVKITDDDKWKLASLSVDARIESLEEYAGMLLVEATKHANVIAAAKREADRRIAVKDRERKKK